MRKVLCALLLSLACTASAPAQNAPWAQKIFFGITNHDFGTVPHGAQLKYRFKIKNIYAVPLDITNIKPSCSCLTYQESSRHLEPQQEGYIDVNMDGTRFKGPKTVYMYVTVGPSFISTAVLQVSANARADVVFNPGEINFGVVQAGDTPSRVLDVEYAGGLHWQITEIVKSKGAPLEITPRELYRQPARLTQTGKVGYQLVITLKGDAPPGPLRQELLLKTNDPISPVLTVVIEGTVQASLAIQPRQVNFNTLKVGQEMTQRIFVRGGRPFRILSIDGINDEVKTTVPTQFASLHVLTIQCQPHQAGNFQHQLVIHTDLGRGDTVAVPVQATVVK
jgi:hypothetical protein